MEKRVMEAVEDYLEFFAHVIGDTEVSGKFVEARKPPGLPKVRPEELNEKRKQHFPDLRHSREAEPLGGKQKTMAGE